MMGEAPEEAMAVLSCSVNACKAVIAQETLTSK